MRKRSDESVMAGMWKVALEDSSRVLASKMTVVKVFKEGARLR